MKGRSTYNDDGTLERDSGVSGTGEGILMDLEQYQTVDFLTTDHDDP